MELKSIDTPKQLLDIAFSRASREAGAGKRPREKAKWVETLEIRKVGMVTEFLQERLRSYVRDVPNISELHPFYRELMGLTIDLDSFKQALGQVEQVSRVIQKLGREHTRKIYACKNDDKAWAIRKQFYARVDSVVKSLAKNLEVIAAARKKLREVPKVRFDLPTVILAGYPNTGKTTMLKRLTTSAPEIASYPFTTKGIKLGYYSRKHLEIQVADTPGLLDRPIEERNNIERKALTALRHLASVIVFILDPTESCGYSLDKQLRLLEEVRKEFTKPLIVVSNKTDLASKEQLEAAAKAGEVIQEGEGVKSELREAVFKAIDWTPFNKKENVFTPVGFGEGPILPKKPLKKPRAGFL